MTDAICPGIVSNTDLVGIGVSPHPHATLPSADLTTEFPDSPQFLFHDILGSHYTPSQIYNQAFSRAPYEGSFICSRTSHDCPRPDHKGTT